MKKTILKNVSETVFGAKLTPENSYGLVLSGGGTRGSYEVGVLKALKELRIPIGGICGTSIGAINAGLFLSNDIKTIEKIYLNISMDDVVVVNEGVDREKDLLSFDNIRAMMGTFIQERGLSNEALKNLIVKHVDIDKIYKSPLEFGIMTTDAETLKPVEIFKEDVPREKLVDYILSSANFPIFKPVETKDKKLVDGGIRDNMPINMMIKKGFRKIIAVDIAGQGQLPAIDDPDVYIKRIELTEDLGGLFEFDRERMERNIQMGYYDSLKEFRKLYGYFYYFTPGYHKKLMEIFDLETLRGIEKAAQLYKIERYRVIKDDSFLKEVYDKHQEAVAKYQETTASNWFTSLFQDPRKISELIDSGNIIVWAQQQRSSAARFERNWLTDLLSDYFSAARGMIELDYFLKEKRSA